MERLKFEIRKVKGGYQAVILKGWFNREVKEGNVVKTPSGAILSVLKGFDFSVDNK